MILAESLWPGMTRQGFGVGTYVSVAPSDRELFPVTEDGRWLPKQSDAERAYGAAMGLMERQEIHRSSLAAIALRTIEVSDSGCYVGPDITPNEHTDILWQLAQFDMGGLALNSKATKAVLKVCDTQECLNARHYDFTHRVANRDRLFEPNPAHYTVLDDGILPIWELAADEPFMLPTVEQSAKELRDLQLRCVPFVEDPREAPLSANAISKITLDPVTGCWVTRTYYNKPADFEKSFMYDGYGRLGFGPALKREGYPEGRYLAHRVIWAATGHTLQKRKVLNHECGFHPCCNPSHIRQVTSGQNNDHARRMVAALRGEVVK